MIDPHFPPASPRQPFTDPHAVASRWRSLLHGAASWRSKLFAMAFHLVVPPGASADAARLRSFLEAFHACLEARHFDPVLMSVPQRGLSASLILVLLN